MYFIICEKHVWVNLHYYYYYKLCSTTSFSDSLEWVLGLWVLDAVYPFLPRKDVIKLSNLEGQRCVHSLLVQFWDFLFVAMRLNWFMIIILLYRHFYLLPCCWLIKHPLVPANNIILCHTILFHELVLRSWMLTIAF